MIALLLSCGLWIDGDEVRLRTDADADGFFSRAVGGNDCDDSDPEVRPGAREIWYDGVDQDCSGGSDFDQDKDGLLASAYGGTDCDDTDRTVRATPQIWHADCDGDGLVGSVEVPACDRPTTLAVCDGQPAAAWRLDGVIDCDDADASVPAAEETWYDGVDQDCDGGNDYDADGDGFVPDAWLAVAPPGSVGGDCDDADPTVWPGAVDPPFDDVDSACDGDVFEHDRDRDGFEPPLDCDDLAAFVHPAAVEVWYDGVDQDCDGADDHDRDGDGFRPLAFANGAPADCDDGDPSVYPGAPDVPYDGVDADCLGDPDYDLDGDGFVGGGPFVTGLVMDCDDGDPSVSPVAQEVWYDGVDQDCDGGSDHDADRDGWVPLASAAFALPGEQVGDCDDHRSDVHPGAPDPVDGVDADCDGVP
ncbi:MAG: hypothetical protein H6734_08870 [Alphaproteobacteria bacterium]|nr:hypothetical protein [Alphaproteobacteria bacterium]